MSGEPKMKICVVSPSQNAYSETFIRAHIDELNAVAVFEDWPYYEHAGRRIVPRPWRVGVHIGPRLPVLLRSVPERLAVRSVAGFLRRKRIDVVLAEYGPTAVDLIDPCRVAGVPLVAHFHGCDAYHRDILKQHAESYPRLFAAAAGVIVVSRDMERQLLGLGAAPERLFCNPCGVDLEAFSATDASANEPIFLAVGRFVEKKAPYLTLLAFERALAACPGARLIYAGDGDMLGACRQMAGALGVSGQVEFLGHRSHAEVAALMKKARAFVQHSAVASSGDREGTPVAILEAAASGLPVIATRHAGIPEAVIHGETGLLVDELDIEAMAEHIAVLATDAGLAGALGRRARQHIRVNYSMAKSVQGLNTILRKASGLV